MRFFSTAPGQSLVTVPATSYIEDNAMKRSDSSSSMLVRHDKRSQPMTIPSRNSSRSSSSSRTPSSKTGSGASTPRTRRRVVPGEKHQKDALPASVAALLAMTAIPPPRNTPRKRRTEPRRVSIDDLVQEWRSEALSMPSYGSHKSMSVLLAEDDNSETEAPLDEFPDMLGASRCSSSDSVPSLEDVEDDTSLLSMTDPPTPASLPERRSVIGSTRKTYKSRSYTIAEDCNADHPLSPRPRNTSASKSDQDGAAFIAQSARTPNTTPRPSFRSNLTSSLQNLKTRALSSLSQLSLNNAGPNLRNTPYAFTDDMLWQHPYIFPRLSPEIRPVSFSGTPESASRRYFNPTILSFEEQQRVYREALHHSPAALPDAGREKRCMMIQMQTYGRVSGGKRGASNGNSACGTKELTGSKPLVRQREPRENGDFLRVVVLEMNMRRVGKLEDSVAGRARIWLPPRQQQDKRTCGGGRERDLCLGGGPPMAAGKRVPGRWVGVAADEL